MNERSSVWSDNKRLYCASCSCHKIVKYLCCSEWRGAYRIWVHNKGTTNICAIWLVAHSECHQEDTLVCNIVTGRLYGISEIISRFWWLRDDDRSKAKLDRWPVNLQHLKTRQDEGQNELLTFSSPLPLLQTLISGPLASAPSPDPRRLSIRPESISCVILVSLSRIDSNFGATWCFSSVEVKFAAICAVT